jgi:exopolysaccharide production protein ExoY
MNMGLGRLYEQYPAVFAKDDAANVEPVRRLEIADGWGASSAVLGAGFGRAPNGDKWGKQAQIARSLAWAIMVSPESEIISRARAVLDADSAREPGDPVDKPVLDTWPKRALDVMVAGAALVLIAPLMLLSALAIRLTMGGPVVYAQTRVGRDGKKFRCFKFRTMVKDSDAVLEQHLATDPESALEWKECRKLAKDPRITPLGQFLRRSSMDELPQLFNVLRGEMSCVGPRPVVPEELAYYGDNLADYLSAKPGMTGIWQTCGRNNVSYANRVRMDALYVRRWSMLLDLAILVKTARAVMKCDAP